MHTPSPGVPAPESNSAGLMKAMSPGVVDYLFRQLVAGRPPVDVQWEREGVSLSAQPEGAELARRLAETDLDALTPMELFHYVRAASGWPPGPRNCAGPPSDCIVTPPGSSLVRPDAPAGDSSAGFGTARRAPV